MPGSLSDGMTPAQMMVLYQREQDVLDQFDEAKAILRGEGWMLAKDKTDHLKGGKQGQRDKNYGLTDPNFWDWWHNGGGKQGQNATPEDYKEWEELGKPRGPRNEKP